jgi:hypothetical protein
MRTYVAFFLFLGWLTALPATAQNIVTCSSDNGGRKVCPTDTSRGVTLGKQISGSRCDQGSTWGYDNQGIWVDRGCRAEFIVGAGGNRGKGTPQTITCSSDDGSRKYCPANTTGGVQLTRQRSGSRCVQGSTWGYDNQGIWVDKGCRADFAAYASNGISSWLPWNKGNGNGNGQGVITCSSNDGKRQYCPASISRGGVRMVQQLSGSQCIQGSTWGYDNGGIWVDRGCRASFQIR